MPVSCTGTPVAWDFPDKIIKVNVMSDLLEINGVKVTDQVQEDLKVVIEHLKASLATMLADAGLYPDYPQQEYQLIRNKKAINPAWLEIKGKYLSLERSIDLLKVQVRNRFKEFTTEYNEKEDRTVINHESYGTLNLGVHNGGHGTFFGSGIQSSSYVNLTIRTASHERHLSNDWIFGKERLIEVAFTHDQWNQVVGSFGRGEGVPCTIRHLLGRSIAPPPVFDYRKSFVEDFERSIKRLTENLAELTSTSVADLTDKGTLSMEKRREIAAGIQRIAREVQGSIPFVMSQVQETMETLESQTLSDIQAKAMHLGLQPVQQQHTIIDVQGQEKALPNPDKEV